MADTLLLVSEDALALDVLAEALRPLSWALETSGSAWATIEKLKKNQYVGLIIDRDLPDANGLEVLKETRRMQPNAATIVYVAYPGNEAMVEALQAGASDVFEKPFPAMELVVERVRNAVVRQQLLVERDTFATRISELESAAALATSTVDAESKAAVEAAARKKLMAERDALAKRVAELEIATKSTLGASTQALERQIAEHVTQRQRLQAERDAFATRIAELEISAQSGPPPPPAPDAEDLRQQVAAAAKAEVDRVTQAARDHIAKLTQQLQAESVQKLTVATADATRQLQELQQRFEAIKARHIKALNALKQGAATIANILGASTLPPTTNNEFRELRRMLTQVIEDRS